MMSKLALIPRQSSLACHRQVHTVKQMMSKLALIPRQSNLGVSQASSHCQTDDVEACVDTQTEQFGVSQASSHCQTDDVEACVDTQTEQVSVSQASSHCQTDDIVPSCVNTQTELDCILQANSFCQTEGGISSVDTQTEQCSLSQASSFCQTDVLVDHGSRTVVNTVNCKNAVHNNSSLLSYSTDERSQFSVSTVEINTRAESRLEKNPGWNNDEDGVASQHLENRGVTTNIVESDISSTNDKKTAVVKQERPKKAKKRKRKTKVFMDPHQNVASSVLETGETCLDAVLDEQQSVSGILNAGILATDGNAMCLLSEGVTANAGGRNDKIDAVARADAAVENKSLDWLDNDQTSDVGDSTQTHPAIEHKASVYGVMKYVSCPGDPSQLLSQASVKSKVTQDDNQVK